MADIDINIEKPSQKAVEIEKGVAANAKWGSIVGDINNQADLQATLDELRELAYAGL